MTFFGAISGRSGGGSSRLASRTAFLILLLLLCLVTYHGITDNFFFNDDFLWLREAQHSMNARNVLGVRVIDFFRPLVNLSFFAMERLSPGDIWLYNIFNLLLHYLNTILVYVLVLHLLRDRLEAALAAVLFAVTSVHNGAVFWISARTTLLSTAFLLGSLVLLTRPRRTRAGLAAATALYALALASKETAAVGFLLALFLFALYRRGARERPVGGAAVFSLGAVSVCYFVLRAALMGRFFQPNWAPGLHALRNAAGGFLYQLYPWPLFSFVFHSAGTFSEPQHSLWPEIIVAPVLLALLWLGKRTRMLRSVILASGWTIIALVPSSFFTYRFFSTDSMTQNRYYYLSSVGSVMLITLLLAMLWKSKSGVRRAGACVLIVFLCAGYMIRIDRLEKRWDAFTHNYQRLISIVIDETRKAPAVSCLAIDGAPMEFKYLEAALLYLHPGWTIHRVDSADEIADAWKPCLYIHFTLLQQSLEVKSVLID